MVERLRGAGACGAGRPSIWYEGMDNGDGYYIEGRSASQNRHERGESTGEAVICLHRELCNKKANTTSKVKSEK